MTRKGCVLPSSMEQEENHHHSSPATARKTVVSDEPRAQESSVSEVTPDDCSPILVWLSGSSDPDVYLMKRKCPKSSAGMLPPPPAPAQGTEPSPPAARQLVQKVRRPRQRRVLGKWCRHCTSSETPQWRAGPEGPSTLCNACGIRYREGRLLPEYRPMASPGFEPSKHANQHRKVLQLHRRARQQHLMMGGENRRRDAPAPPPEQPPRQVTNEELPAVVIGNNDDDVQEGSGGDHLMYELPLPWRWNSHNKGLVGMGESSSEGYWCPLCEAVI